MRGGQPTAEGYPWLVAHGITNIVKLNSDAEGSDAAAIALGMTVHKIPITESQQLFGPVGQQVTNAVAHITPGTYVHCGSDARSRSELDQRLNTQGGQDRTGLVCAAYEVWVMKAPKPEAQARMLAYGFHKALHGLWDFFEDHV